TLNSLSAEHKQAVMDQANKTFSASDAIMSRCISTAISLSWTDAQVREKAAGIVAAAKKAIAGE
ncbi:MAG TPA: L-glutamine--2-deoxy-scyllo-inosose aminotransferase KanB, partial [Chitinophagaceae bacterium]|nr:L-glutamine--2-deoxy-scyllo-inosose aminotransferase KanB [Chitinophagaceae bacterium]